MNPFDLAGPQFLLFFLVFGVVVLVVCARLRRAREGGDPVRLDVSDPYLVAYLRGDVGEAACVAVLSLVERKLVTPVGDSIQAMRHAMSQQVKPLERAVIAEAAGSIKATALAGADTVRRACDDYAERLRALRLLPDDGLSASRRRDFMIGGGVLAAVAIIKIGVALSRGRTNITFLIGLGIAFVVGAYFVTHPRRTTLGDFVMNDVESLFSGLRARTAALSQGEMDLMAAVFGVSALRGDAHPYVSQLYPEPQRGGYSSGSSDSSSSSCGSSCGGGGGGCGGCGS